MWEAQEDGKEKIGKENMLLASGWNVPVEISADSTLYAWGVQLFVFRAASSGLFKIIEKCIISLTL